MKINKKADLEIQINWIFIIIIGALIILFFIGVVLRQKSASTTKIESELTKNIDTIISTAQTSPNAFNKIEIPRSKIYFSCPDCVCGITISKVLSPTKLQDKSLFMLSSIDDSILHLWTQENNVGFNINNFVYISSPSYQFVIVQNESNQLSRELASEINKTLSENFNVLLINQSSLFNTVFNTNFRHYRFVFCLAEPTESNKNAIANTRVSALYISTYNKALQQESIFENPVSGNITFLDYVPSLGSQWSETPSHYYNKASLYAAIFTDSEENFRCGIQNSFEKFNYIATIYLGKIEQLSALAQYCSMLYNQAKPKIEYLTSLPALQYDKTVAFNLSRVNIELNDINNQLLQVPCPSIY